MRKIRQTGGKGKERQKDSVTVNKRENHNVGKDGGPTATSKGNKNGEKTIRGQNTYQQMSKAV